MDFIIKMKWDNEANRWAAIGSAGMGLILESDSYDALVERVKLAAPEMIHLNFNYKGPINLYFISEHIEHLKSVV